VEGKKYVNNEKNLDPGGARIGTGLSTTGKGPEKMF